jgi:hypothetical protein
MIIYLKQMNYLKKLALFSVFIGILIFLFNIFFKEYFTPFTIFIYIFFILITALSHIILEKYMVGKAPKNFISIYMLISFLKFFLYIIIITGYVFFIRTNAINFLFTFFIFYVFYTIFEVLTLINKN